MLIILFNGFKQNLISLPIVLLFDCSDRKYELLDFGLVAGNFVKQQSHIFGFCFWLSVDSFQFAIRSEIGHVNAFRNLYFSVHHKYFKSMQLNYYYQFIIIHQLKCSRMPILLFLLTCIDFVTGHIFQEYSQFLQMYKLKTEPTFTNELKSQSPAKDFKQKAANILTKIEAVHSELEESKLTKFKQFLSDVTDLEQCVDEEIRQKRKLFEALLLQINTLAQELEEEEQTSQKINMQIRSRIEAFTKTHQKAFQKIKTDRIETQDRIQRYLNQKMQALCKKNILYKIPLAIFNQLKDELSTIKKEVISFFEEAQASEQKTKKQIFSAIEQCAMMMKNNEMENIENEAVEYMRIIQMEVEGRVCKLGEERQRMQQQVLGLLEKVHQATVGS